MIPTPSWSLDAERDLLREMCTPGRHPRALWNFTRYAAGWEYRCRDFGKMWLQDRVHGTILDDIQQQIDKWWAARRAGHGYQLRIMLILFRGSGKSRAITQTVPLFVNVLDPNLSVAIGSETHPKAKRFLGGIKGVIQADSLTRFAWLFGNWYDSDRTWNTEEIVHAARTSQSIAEASIGTFGVDTGITGQHPMILVFDDPLSKEKLKEGGNWNEQAVKCWNSVGYALQPDGIFIGIGTRYLDDDPIGTALLNDGVASWHGLPPPAGMTPFPTHPRGWHVYHLPARDVADTSNYAEGEPTLPESGWTHERLIDDERKQPKEHAAQMMNNPTSSLTQEITAEQIENIRMDRPARGDIPFKHAVIHIDTAFKNTKTKGKGDRSVIVTVLHDLRDNGRVYIDKINASKEWRSEDFDTQLIYTLRDLRARSIRVRAIVDEKGIGGKDGVVERHYEDVIRRANVRIPELRFVQRAGTRKTQRIIDGVPYWLEGHLRIFNDCATNVGRDNELDILIHEMTRIGVSTHDDIADACADIWLDGLWTPPFEDMEEDEQPDMPRQPGDDILKRYERQFRNTRGNYAANDDPDPQPYDSMLEVSDGY